MANFALSADTIKKQAAYKAEQDAIKAKQADRGKAMLGGELATPDELMRHNAAEFAKWDAESADQAARGGVETADAVTGAQGIAGFFGGKEKTTHYTAGRSEDTTTANNKARLDELAYAARNRQIQQMSNQVFDTQGQMANAVRQNKLLDQISAAARGEAPSAAQAQLKMGADRNMANALAMAAAGGTPAAARQAAFQRAAITQDLAGQSAALRAQEIQGAQSLAAGALQGARAQDIGLASEQAGLRQDTAKTNLLASIEQQKQKDLMVSQYVAQGMSLDDAKRRADIQQAQFNADLLARQAAADKGISMQSAASGGQTLGALAAAAGTIAASASDERAKENIADGDKSVESFLDKISAKDWDYKDPKKHGEGRRTGIMAQDAERSPKGSEMIVVHPDGTKMIDHGKAISTSLAALANINKRLRELES